MIYRQVGNKMLSNAVLKISRKNGLGSLRQSAGVPN